MPGHVADSILKGAREALAYAKGKAEPSDYRVHVPQQIDVRAIRKATGLTQEQFAAAFGFSVATLRKWELGTRQPEGPARAYLTVIEHDPLAVQKALVAR